MQQSVIHQPKSVSLFTFGVLRGALCVQSHGLRKNILVYPIGTKEAKWNTNRDTTRSSTRKNKWLQFAFVIILWYILHKNLFIYNFLVDCNIKVVHIRVEWGAGCPLHEQKRGHMIKGDNNFFDKAKNFDIEKKFLQ